MNDVKTCKRFIRFYPDDLAACETWLSGLAAQGLFLAEMGRWRAVFERLAPCAAVRYRIEPTLSPQDSLPIRERELYDDAGWFYVCTWDKNYHIFRTDDPDAPELQTDPESHALALERILRRQGPILIFCFLITAYLLGSFLYQVIVPQWPLKNLIRSNEYPFFELLFLLWLFSIACARGAGFLRILFQWRALRRGEPFNHHRRQRTLPRGAVSFALFLAMVAGIVSDQSMTTYRTIQDTDGLPYVSVLELVDEEGLEIPFVRDGFSAHDGGLTEEQNYAYCYQTTHTLWAPTVQFVRQMADAERDGGRTSAQLEVTRYRMLTQGLADRLYDELAGDMSPLPAPGCDRAAEIPADPEHASRYLALQDGKTVLYVQSDFDILDDMDRFAALLE